MDQISMIPLIPDTTGDAYVPGLPHPDSIPLRPNFSPQSPPANNAVETEQNQTTVPSSHRVRNNLILSTDLNEDDRFLVRLKEDEGLPWTEISQRFLTDRGKCIQVRALQMRYKRLHEKFRIWEHRDCQALKLSHEYYEKYKFEIISAKMLDFSIEERWPVRQCARKWLELVKVGTISDHNLPQPPLLSSPKNEASRSINDTPVLPTANLPPFPLKIEGSPSPEDLLSPKLDIKQLTPQVLGSKSSQLDSHLKDLRESNTKNLKRIEILEVQLADMELQHKADLADIARGKEQSCQSSKMGDYLQARINHDKQTSTKEEVVHVRKLAAFDTEDIFDDFVHIDFGPMTETLDSSNPHNDGSNCQIDQTLVRDAQALCDRMSLLEQSLAQRTDKEQDLEMVLANVWQALVRTGSPDAQPESPVWRLMKRFAANILSTTPRPTDMIATGND